MSSGLDPVILQKLAAFSRRRRKLIIFRGIAAAVAMLLASMMLVALLDWLFVLPDWVRWTLSAVAYLSVIVTEWRACLRLLIHAPDERHLARLIEHAEPKLREDLISAVELGQGDATMDSEQFRRLVQSDVATRLEAVDMDALLPVQLLRRTLILASAIVLGCLIVFAASGFQFGTLLMRAMLPMANLARVSKVQVTIVEPAPADTTAAQGDTVPLIIEIGGQRTNKAVLETFTKDGGREIIPMVASGPDRFSASIQVARADVAYRVRAGDALTRKYQLRAAARPNVVSFHKKFRYPAYSKLPDTESSEEAGDLVGLEGSEVELGIKTDQPVKTAELLVEQGKQLTTIPLQPDNNGRLAANLSLTASGIYRVRLIAASTGFENKFSPEYEIRAEPDLIPQVDLELPKRDLIVPANEVIDLKATASDDLGLAKIAQLVRINEGPWREQPLDVALGKTASVDRRWDLYDQGFKAGDLVTTKLVAVDLKGNRAESRPVRLSIIASGFESKRMTSLDSLRQLQVSIKALREAAETLEKRSRETREQFDRLSPEDPLRKQAAVSFASGIEEFAGVAATTTSQLNATLRNSTAGHSSGELVLLGRLLAKMTSGTFQNAADQVRLLTGNESAEFTMDLVREAADACARTAQRARLADDATRVFVTSEAIDVLNENVQVVAREQERINSLVQPAADEPDKWRPLITRLRVVLAQTKSLEELMAAAAESGSDNAPDRLRRMARDVAKQREAVDRILERPDVRMELAEPIRNLTKATTELRRQAFDLKRDFMGPPARMAQNILQDVQPTWANFEKLRNEAETIFRNERIPVETRNDLMQARWNAKAAVLKGHGDAEESRPDADTYFVSDLRATTLALGGLRDAVLLGAKPFKGGERPAESFGILDRSVRILEAAHNLAEIHDGLMRLATAERWEVTALRARTANPRDWEWLEARLKVSPEELGRLQLKDAPVRDAIAAAQKVLREAERDAAWRNINEEMKQRMKPNAVARPMPLDAERVAAFTKQALDLLREPIEAARKSLAELTPKLSDMMSQLAKQAEKLKERSAEQAEKAKEKAPEEVQAEAKEQLAQQRDLNEQLEAVKDALRSDANKQDMFAADGRERARDADDALAMLKEPPPKAEDALSEAAMTPESAEQKAALEQASEQQQKLADALNKLSEHYKALDEGNPEQTRLALRQAEQELGAKEALDERYARAEQLAQLAQSSPQEMLQQLEKALPQNPQMQQELSAIAKNTVSDASQKLNDAFQRENAVSQQVTKLAQEQQARAAAQAAAQAAAAQNPSVPNPADKAPADSTAPAQQPAQPVNSPQQPNPSAPNQPQPQSDAPAANKPAGMAPNQDAPAEQGKPQSQPSPPQDPQLAQAANQQAPIAQATTQAGEDVARAGRHEQRLQNTATGERLENLGNEIRETAMNEVAKAQQNLLTRPMAAESQPSVDAAKAELQHEVGELAAAQSATPATSAARPNMAEAAQQPAATPPSSAAASPVPQSPQQPGQQQPAGQQPGQPAGQMAQQQSPAGQQQPQAGNTTPQQPGQSPQNPNGQTPRQAQNAASTPAIANPGMFQQPGATPLPQNLAGPATPQEQVWMARTLDALDAALNATAAPASEQQAQQGEQGQQGQAQQGQQQGQQAQKGQAQSDAMAQAKQAMNSAAQAASAAARSARSQEGQKGKQPSSEVAQGDQQSKSETGAQAQAGDQGSGTLPDAQIARTKDWGKLPKKVAEQLNQGQRETVAGEYRNQVETYYRVIAEKAKKPLSNDVHP